MESRNIRKPSRHSYCLRHLPAPHLSPALTQSLSLPDFQSFR